MKLIDKNLYLEFDDAIECAFGTREYLSKEKCRGTASMNFIKDPDDARKSLIEFESLKPKYKDLVTQKFGNPYDHFAKAPIRRMVIKDLEAEKFYLAYRYNDNEILDEGAIAKYTTAASWLNMLIEVSKNKKEIKKQLNISLAEFYIKVGEIIKAESIALPSSPRFLLPKIKEYQEQKYTCLIHGQTGKKTNLKVKTELAESTLLQMIANHNQFDDVFVCYQYNKWANANDLPAISPATVGLWRRRNEPDIIVGREGNSAFNEKFIKSGKGLLPSCPLALVEHDDNNLDFLFSDEDGYKFNRYVSICVIDSRTKLLLGKSYTVGESPQMWQIHQAYVDAMYYIRSLTGGWYKPWELKADKWAIKSMLPFYNKIGKFIPPSHGNKHRGYIEPFFGSTLWKRAQQFIGQANWNGNNMTAKHEGVNKEMLRLNAGNRPLIGKDAEQQIENFFHLLRHMPDFKRTDMQAPSKEEQFLAEWDKLSIEEKRPITDEQFLLTFGIKHEPDGRQISITNRGIEPQINNCKYSYDLPETWMYNKFIGEKVNVIYDPYDMSRVLIVNDDIRFIAKSAQLIPRAMKDQYTGSRTFLNALLAEKKLQVKEVSDKTAKRKNMIKTDHFNAQAMLQGGVLLKEEKNHAEQKSLEDHYEKYDNFLNETDFSQYLNT